MEDLEQEITRLLARHRGLIRSILTQNSHRFGHVDVEDVEQEVAIRLFQALKREIKIDNPASYIATVVNTTLLDVIRKASRRLPEGADGGHHEVAGGPQPQQTWLNRERLQQVEACLAELPDNRAIVVRLQLQGYSHQEMAEITGWTTGKIRNLASRGMQALKAKLKEQGVELEDD